MIQKKEEFDQRIFKLAAEERFPVPESLRIRLDLVCHEIRAGKIEKQKPSAGKCGSVKQKRHMTWKKTLCLGAACLALLGVTAFGGMGAWQKRMERMNHEKIERYFQQIYVSKLPADNYNRPLTKEEEERLLVLTKSYETQNLFPEGEIRMIESREDYKGKEVAFLADTGTFFLPKDTLSEEQLLQIVDFRHKRDYSLLQMNQKIEKGEALLPKAPDLQGERKEEVIKGETQEPVIPYQGDLSIQYMASGNDCIFLTGWNAIHKMEVEGSHSELFFDEFQGMSKVTALCQGKDGRVYFAAMEDIKEELHPELGVPVKTYGMSLFIADDQGNLIRKLDLSHFREEGNETGLIRRLAADENGYLYIRASGIADADICLILDENGKEIGRIGSGAYTSHFLGGMCLGKDGRVYTMIMETDSDERRMGIAAIDPEACTLSDIYPALVPADAVLLDLIAPGAETDFVFWGYGGIYTYNLGDERAVLTLPAYEAPCQWEGVLYCALPDGRVVFGAAEEYVPEKETTGLSGYGRVPEDTVFYYKSSVS